MKKLVTHMDRHGRVLIPSNIRGILNIQPGDKVNIEIHDHEVRIINADRVIDEMHALFTKNQHSKKKSIVHDFMERKQQEYKIEEERSNIRG